MLIYHRFYVFIKLKIREYLDKLYFNHSVTTELRPRTNQNQSTRKSLRRTLLSSIHAYWIILSSSYVYTYVHIIWWVLSAQIEQYHYRILYLLPIIKLFREENWFHFFILLVPEMVLCKTFMRKHNTNFFACYMKV